MPLFEYSARNSSGSLVKGKMEGATSQIVASQLSASGMMPIDITLTTNSVGLDLSSIFSTIGKEKVKPIDVQLFSRHLYTLLKAGVPLMRGLGGLQESATNKTFKTILTDLRDSLDSGRELSTAMAEHPGEFSDFYISMVRVGEMTGRLDSVFLRLFDHMEFERDMRERITVALRYPMFVGIAMAAAIAVINIFVIPAFAKVYAGFNATLPLMTRILIGSSNATVAYWPHMLIGILAVVFGFRKYVASGSGKYNWDKLKLKFPIVGTIILKGTMARFARSFALTNRSGVPIIQGLSVVAHTVDNAYIGAQLDKMRDGLERGESILRTAVKADVFTPVVLQMIAVGEETGSIDDLMDEIADMYQREVDYEIKTLSAQIEPILIVGLGILVLILALGIFLPIWDLGKVALHK